MKRKRTTVGSITVPKVPWHQQGLSLEEWGRLYLAGHSMDRRGHSPRCQKCGEGEGRIRGP